MRLLYNVLLTIEIFNVFIYSMHTVVPVYFVQHCCICRPLASIGTEDGGFELRTLLKMYHIRMLFF
jgi:hypothetical protein